MGTLVEKKKTTKPASARAKKESDDTLDLTKEETKKQRKLERKVEKEYAKLRLRMEDIRQAYAYVEAADAYDDISKRLKNLEKMVKHVRLGGSFTRGARQHKRLLRQLNK